MRASGEIADRATLRKYHAEQYELSADAAHTIMAHHGLGVLKSFTQISGSFLNTVFEMMPEQGDPLILKVHQRHALGSLEADHAVTRSLSASTDLPVSKLCLLNTDGTIIPHPYLIVNKLPGESAREAFEQSDHATRLELSEQLGEVVGTIHAKAKPDPALLRPLDLNQWQALIEEAICAGDTLQDEITAYSKTFYPEFAKRMTAISDVPKFNESPVCVWCDPHFHNVLVTQNGKGHQITGIYDFQMAGYGPCQFDFFYIEGDFRQRHPREVYEHPDYPVRFYQGYKTTGEASGTEDIQFILRELILCAQNIRFWWNCLGILHLTTPRMLENILNGLDNLSNGGWATEQ